MLESDDVDDDFFTPTKPTSLANIFGSDGKVAEKHNPTLKYVAPKPEDLSPKDASKLTESQSKTECLFALALFTYELVSNTYLSRGKLGFAIMKIVSHDQIKLILYDSSKRTLSSATVKANLEVIIQKNNYINYVDDNNKSWSLVCSDSEELTNIVKELKTYDVKLKFVNEITHPPITEKPSRLKDIAADPSNKGSDTDSILQRKNKASILSRMAMVGQAILPAQPIEQTSDSSDTNEYKTHKAVRHKHSKNILKKNIDRQVSDVYDSYENISPAQNTTIMPIQSTSTDNISLFTTINGQLVPVTQTITKSHDNPDFNNMLSEQRISNSELRINISKMDFKVDQILERIKVFEQKDGYSDPPLFAKDIYNKLLSEYENKIKDQNEKIKVLEAQVTSQNYNLNNIKIDDCEDNTQNINIYENKIISLEKGIADNDIELSSLRKQLSETVSEKEALKKINEDHADNFDKKVKNIMNNTFHALSNNFEDDENYTGKNIKRIIATTIRKLTIQNLEG